MTLTRSTLRRGHRISASMGNLVCTCSDFHIFLFVSLLIRLGQACTVSALREDGF